MMSITGLSGKAQTVLGPIAPDQLGITDTHEHLLIDFRCVFQEPETASQRGIAYAPVSLENLGWVRYYWTSSLDNLQLLDEETAIEEVALYRRVGGQTVVDVTNIGINRDPLALARISRATGLNIIMGSSYYIGSTHPTDMNEKTVEAIADEIVADLTTGVGNTDIRAGIIGEVGCSWPWTESERKVVHASALAQQRTGAPLTIHPGRYETAPLEIVAFLQEVGADLSRTVMCHIERTIFKWDTLMALAGSGCYLEYDLFGHESSYYPLEPSTYMPSDAQRIDQIGRLISEGFVDRVLLAQDVCAKHRLAHYGGHGYDHLLKNITPRMVLRGITEEQLNTMLVENPKRLLTFV
jgi:phosphotriesterase-related protein